MTSKETTTSIISEEVLEIFEKDISLPTEEPHGVSKTFSGFVDQLFGPTAAATDTEERRRSDNVMNPYSVKTAFLFGLGLELPMQ